MTARLALFLAAQPLLAPQASAPARPAQAADAASARLVLSQQPPPSASAPLDVRELAFTPRIEGPILDLAWLADDRLLALTPRRVDLYAFEDSVLDRLASHDLPGPFDTVRAAGGLLVASPAEQSVWALASGSAGAVLLGVDGGRRLVERLRSDALPWPGCAHGLRYRPGTNLLEAEVDGLGRGPFLRLLPVEGGLAVSAEGRLTAADQPSLDQRVGPAVAELWPGALLAASAAPPAGIDTLFVVLREDGRLRIGGSFDLEGGAVRVLAGRRRHSITRLAAAVEGRDGGFRLAFLEVARP